MGLSAQARGLQEDGVGREPPGDPGTPSVPVQHRGRRALRADRGRRLPPDGGGLHGVRPADLRGHPLHAPHARPPPRPQGAGPGRWGLPICCRSSRGDVPSGPSPRELGSDWGSLSPQPENILCVAATGHMVKIIDFGLARRCRAPPLPVSSSSCCPAPTFTSACGEHGAGCPRWRPPCHPASEPPSRPQVQPPGEAESEFWHPRVPLPRGGQLRAGLLLHGHVEHGRHHLHAVRRGPFWGLGPSPRCSPQHGAVPEPG